AESEARFRSSFDQAAVGIAHVCVEGRYLQVNDKLCDILGCRREELLGRTFGELTHPEDPAGGDKALKAMLGGEQTSFVTEKRYRRNDGAVVWVKLVSTLKRSEDGVPEHFLSIFEDITARKMAEFRLQRLNRLHTVLSKTSEAVVRMRDRQALYETVCRILVEDGLLRMAWIAELDEDTGRARQAAAFGEGQEFLHNITITTDSGPLSQGPVGTALRTGVCDVCNDFAGDGRVLPWREKALRHGFLAAAAFPIKLDATVIAALVIGSSEKGYFQEDEIRMMADVANNLAFAIESLQKEQQRQEAEKALHASEAGMATAQRIAHFGSWEIDLEGGVYVAANRLRWSDEMFRIAGFEPGSVDVTNALFFQLVPPEEREAIRQAVASAVGQGPQYSIVHRLIRPSGEERTVHETAKLFFNEETGLPVKMVGTAHDITDRKRGEAEIQRTTDLLSAVADGAPDAVFVKDLQGRYLLFNEAAARFVGRPAAEVIGQDDTAIFGPADALVVMESDRQVMLSGLVQTTEEVLTADGTTRIYQATKAPHRDRHGNIVGMIGISRDITERKHAEEKVRQSEASMAAAQRIAKVGNWDLNVVTGELYWSAQVFALFGVPVCDSGLIYATFLKSVHPADQERMRKAVESAVAEDAPYNVEYRVLRPDGTARVMHGQGEVLRDATGRALRMTGTVQDITERKQAEETLQLLSSAVEQSKESILITDAQPDLPGPRILFVNPAFTQMTGYTAQEVVGKTPRMLQGPRTDREVMKRLRHNLTHGETFEGDTVNYRKDGTEFHMEWQIAPIRNASGKVTHFVAIQRDVTERQKHRRLALRSQRLESLGTLAGGVAHDLNNALAPIMLGLDLMRIRHPQECGIIDVFETSARRGADMVRQLLSFASGAEGARVSIQPSHLVAELESMMRASFPKNIRVVIASEPGLPTVLGDATQVHQILLNLCVNARDAMPHGGVLTVETQQMEMDVVYASAIPDARPGHYVVLRVRDTGTGIPAEIIDRIFDPFFTTKDADRGTGLGLSTVLGIVKGHGGFLHVYSQPGQGSTFAVYLPVHGARAEEAEAPAEVEFRGQGETILLVDDEPLVLEIGRRVLQRLGFTPLTATDGADGLVVLAQHRDEVRAIITDLHMPHMDGLAFVRALRRLLPHIPVVIASGRMEETLRGEFKSLGVTQRLDKPFAENQLAQALKKLLVPE
ncbi:MAG: domain S-box-containing protein, partial [Verrucomicrobiaceae bacterium]|nr:domain S-box-containing protein [Verrucomicrobiaceae bacterium]